jgi:Tfp pilus assembly protein PilF
MNSLRRDAALFSGALAVRLLHLIFAHRGPLFRYLPIDSAFYDDAARRLAQGQGFPSGVFFMNPLYGTFLGAVYAVFGSAENGRLAAMLVQAALGAGAVVLLARLGAAVDRKRDGLIAAAALAIYGPAVFYDATLLTPSLMLFLTTLAALLALKAMHGRTILAAFLGGTVGLLILGRSSNMLLIPAFAIVLVCHGRTRGLSAGVFVLSVLLTIAPATLHNWLASGDWVAVTANGGMTLWAGNHPGATGVYSQPEFLSSAVPEREAEDYRAEAARRLGHDVTLGESSRYWREETLREWAKEPRRIGSLFLRKLRIWVSSTESQTNLSYYFAKEHSLILRILFLHLGWVLPFALLGLPDLRQLVVPAVPIAVSLMTCLIFYVSSEYRHPAVPCLLLFAVAGLRRVAFELTHRHIIRRCGITVALLASFAVVNAPDPLLSRMRSTRADNYNFGVFAVAAGDLDEAEAFFRRSTAIDPEWPLSRAKLAEVLAKKGRSREAAVELGRAQALAQVEPGDARQDLSSADSVFRQGDFARARIMFLNLASRDPSAAPTALNNAGLCSIRLGENARAMAEFQSALERDPKYVSPLIHLGRLALELGDVATAERRARQALELAPDDERAKRLLVRALGAGS